jgi:hypothetical protein
VDIRWTTGSQGCLMGLGEVPGRSDMGVWHSGAISHSGVGKEAQ